MQLSSHQLSPRTLVGITLGGFGVFFAVAFALLSGNLSPTLFFTLLILTAIGISVGLAFTFMIRATTTITWLVLIGIIAGQVVRISFSDETSSAILLLDIALAAYVVTGLMRSILSHKPIPLSLSMIFLLSFTLWLPVTLLFNSPLLSGTEIVLAASYIGRFVLLAGAYLTTAWLWQNEPKRDWLLNGLLITGISLLGLGFIQLLILPNLIELTKFGWDPHVGRIVATFLDPNYFGMFLTMFFAGTLGVFLHAPHRQQKLWLGSILLITLISIVLTFSRSSYLALAIVTTLILLVKSPRAMVLVIVAALIVGGSIPRARERVVGALNIDATARLRIETWSDTLQIIEDYPLFGVGYNAFGPAQVRAGIREDLSSLAAQGSDSSLLFALATTGVTGTIFYLLFYLALFVEMLTVWRRSATSWKFRGIALAMLGIIPAYLVHSQFVNGLFYPHLFVPFALLAGIILADTRSQKATK